MSAPLDRSFRSKVGSSLARGRLLWFLLPVAMLAVATARDAAGQERRKPAGARQTRSTEELPDPIDIKGNELVTQDGVVLKATFYPSAKGKEAVPVILLHSWKGSRKDYYKLAVTLWEAGDAVLVPDLRGHGQSTTQYVGGNAVELSAARFRPADFANMVQFDMETLTGYLIKKNNAGELNIEKLCVVGAEMGATVALNWAVYDWSWPQYPGIKQGQHVKALVLLSPETRFKGIGIEDALRNPLLNRFLSIYILLGSGDSKLLSQNEHIYNMLARLHPQPSEEQAEKDQTLFYKAFDTKAQGARLFDPRLNLNAERKIQKFIQLRLINKDYPWAETGRKAGRSGGR